MNPDAFVFVPTQDSPKSKGGETKEANLATLTVDTNPNGLYDHESVIQDASFCMGHRYFGDYNNNNNNNNNKYSKYNGYSDNICKNVNVFDDSLMQQVKFQIEYHFSDTNLSMDNYLLSRMHEDEDYWVPVKTVANLTKIRSLTENEETVLEAIKSSDMLILNEDETKVKRPSFVPPKPKQHKDLRRTVFLYGLPNDMANEESVIKLCAEFGKVKNVSFDKESKESKESKDFDYDKNSDYSDMMEDGPDRDVALVLMTKRFGGRLIRQSSMSQTNNDVINNGNEMLNGIVPPSPSPLYCHPISNPNGNALDFSHLRSCFVVFESQSQANKLVKIRSRAQDGIRAMHQYDFNKARKKVAAAKAKGISPVFSPAHIALALSPNHDSSKILANTVAITPKDGHKNNGESNSFLSPSMNNQVSFNRLSNLSVLSLPQESKLNHRDSNESFMSQGSEASITNIALPSQSNDAEWRLKQENFELQRQNLNLQQALQENIEAMKRMQIFYTQQQRSSHGNHGKHAMTSRNGALNNHSQARMNRRNTFDNRAHSTRNDKEMNLHFGDWRHSHNMNNKRNECVKRFTNSNKSNTSKSANGNKVGYFGGFNDQLFINSMEDELFSHVRSDDMDDDIILPETIDDLPDLDVEELFFELDNQVAVTPSNTPHSLMTSSFGSDVAPIASISDASLLHFQQQQQKQQTKPQ